eukprot:SAG22_NODE_2170_length_2894_cov_4.900894_1_plen_51_part_10
MQRYIRLEPVIIGPQSLAIAMATAGGGAASEREQTALGYLVEQSGLDEKEV